MARFVGRNFGLLNRLYNFVAGAQSAPVDFAVEAPIQPVHDLSRMAELGGGIGNMAAPGYWLIGPQNVHAGADDVWWSHDPRTIIAAAPQFQAPSNPLDIDVWFLDAYVWSATATIIAAANLVAYFPALPGQTIQTGKLLANFTGRVAVANIAASDTDDAGTPGSSTNFVPVHLPIGTLLNGRTAAAAAVAGNISLVARIWVGPAGARPPGLA